uniref:(northern house mosquito) hypothetical protein n=1 Tax=Culex pipiens TaxID=7175 RepID=A0A8D8HE13_CULPI
MWYYNKEAESTFQLLTITFISYKTVPVPVDNPHHHHLKLPASGTHSALPSTPPPLPSTRSSASGSVVPKRPWPSPIDTWLRQHLHRRSLSTPPTLPAPGDSGEVVV